MNSAETINKGNFKLMANPIVVFGKNNEDSSTGIAVMGGYGFGSRFDVEAKASFFDSVKWFGADAEYWLVNSGPVNVSVIGGFHIANYDGGQDAKGPDLTLLASGTVADKLELYGALDFAKTKYDNFNSSFKTWHLVPGFEYKVSPQLDFVGEFGIALNEAARHYVSVGLAFYTKAR